MVVLAVSKAVLEDGAVVVVPGGVRGDAGRRRAGQGKADGVLGVGVGVDALLTFQWLPGATRSMVNESTHSHEYAAW